MKTLKNKLWRLTSEYVRKRDAEGDYVRCVTCGILKPINQMQAGHFIPRAQGLAVYFDLRNIHPQCYRCNINLGGNGAEYYPYMLDRYGQEVVDELRRLSKTTRKITKAEYEEMIEDLQARLSVLNQTD